MNFYRGYTSQQTLGSRGGVIMKLVVANAAVFLLQQVLIQTPFTGFFALSPRLVVTRGHLWRIVTYMFLHGDLMHIAINMFIIWMFGRTLEQIWGSARFLRFYFACGIGGAALSFVFAYNTLVIGASAAAYGILLAYGVLFPNQQILLWFFFPVRAKTLVIGLAILELVKGLSVSDGIAHFAHLGGMAAALILLRGERRLRGLRSFFSGLAERFPVRISLDREDGDKEQDDSDETRKVDSILDKISRKGYENLTETEKRILERYADQPRDR